MYAYVYQSASLVEATRQLPISFSLDNDLIQVFLFLGWLEKFIADVGKEKDASSTLLGSMTEVSESNW